MTLPAITAVRDRPRGEEGGDEKRLDTIHQGQAATHARATGAAQAAARYLRNIHQAEPATKIRLPAMAETNSMRCSP